MRAAKRLLRRATTLTALTSAAAIVVVSLWAIPRLSEAWGAVLLASVAALMVLVVGAAGVRTVETIRRRTERQLGELRSLHRSALSVHGQAPLDALLQDVVDQARELLAARFGALMILDEAGHISSFTVSGMSPEQIRAIGAPPRGEGLLGVAIRDGEALRVADIARHPSSSGFPPGHPPMRSLLAVPVSGASPIRGNLYVAQREDGQEFSALDQEALQLLATQIALACDQVHFRERLLDQTIAEERARFSRDMQDGLAQTIAALATLGQTVRELHRQQRFDEVGPALDRLIETSRQAHSEVRHTILDLRATSERSGLAVALGAHADRLRADTGIEVAARVDLLPPLPPQVELQILRIAQEAIANIRRHARARRAEIAVTASPEAVTLTLSDDGVGLAEGEALAGDGPRLGIATMRERARAIHADLEVLSASAGGGTLVRLTVPLAGASPVTPPAAAVSPAPSSSDGDPS